MFVHIYQASAALSPSNTYQQCIVFSVLIENFNDVSYAGKWIVHDSDSLLQTMRYYECIRRPSGVLLATRSCGKVFVFYLQKF